MISLEQTFRVMNGEQTLLLPQLQQLHTDNPSMSEHRQTTLAGLRGVLLCLSALLLAPLALAANLTNQASVTLAWDRSADDFITNGISYRVYATNIAFSASATNMTAGTNVAVTFTNLAAGNWKFYAVAVQANLESLPSNIIFYTVPTNAPAPPGKFATVYLENSMILTVTNWSDLGFFRARIYIP